MTYRRTATSFHMLSMDDSFNFVEDNASVLTELLISSFIQIGNIVSFYPREGSKNGVEGNQFSVGSLSLDSRFHQNSSAILLGLPDVFKSRTFWFY